MSKAFTPRATARLRTTIVDVITGLVERHTTSGRCEVVTDVARQYPIPIICALLGAPAEDSALFSDWTDDIFKVFSWDVAAHERAILVAWEELDAYIDEMVAHRRHTLTDDLISELIRAEDDGDRLSADELRMLAAGLLIAGTDTTRKQLAASVHVLCDHPTSGRWAQHPELRDECGRGDDAPFPDRVRHAAHGRRGRRNRRRHDPRPAHWSSPTRRRRTAIPPSTTIPTASTSPATSPRRCRLSARACTTASARISPG